MMGLTTRQRDALVFIEKYIRENRCSPKYEEIATAIGLNSRSGAYRVICELEERGAITTKAGRRRSILITAPSLLGPRELQSLTDDQLHQQRSDLDLEISRRMMVTAFDRVDALMVSQ